MHRLYFLFLIHFLLVGKTIAQNSFTQEHEKFIRLHKKEDENLLLPVLRNEEKLIRKMKPGSSGLYRAQFELDRGIYYYMIDEYQSAIASFRQAEKCKGLTPARDRILLYIYLGVSYRNGREDYKKSHVYFDKAIELAEKEKNYDLLAGAVVRKAYNYYSQGLFVKGIRLLESCNKENKRYLSIERRMAIQSLLGQGYDKLGNFAKSYTHFTASVELAERTSDPKLIADRYYEFMGYFMDKQRYGEAKIKALKLVHFLKDKPKLEYKLYDTYAALSQIYSSLNQLDSALFYANISHEYALKTGDAESLSISYSTLGQVYYDRNEYQKSLDLMLKSQEYEEQVVGIKYKGLSYYNIATSYLYLKKYPQAISYLKKANELAKEEGDIYSRYLTYDVLTTAYRESGKLEQAIQTYDSMMVYYDSLNRIETKKELLHLEVRYETKLKEQENKLLKLEVKKHQEAQRNMILLGVIVILLLLGVVYILFINNRLKKSKVAEADAKIQNQKLEEELLNQRLNLLTEEINRKNQLIQSLEDGANSLTEENLLNKVTLENDWLAFMTEFDKIHGAYLSDLKQKFPELTTNNLRLAALVKLEFSNKEIANILCITENGVKKAKQRLKERIKME